MSEFNHRKWFKKQYLEEGMSDEEIHAIKRFEELSNDDKLKLAKIQAMMDRERSLKEDDIEENRLYPEAAYFDNIIKLIKSETMKHGGSEIDEAMDVMKFIGQHYGINFEFGRG